MILQSDPQWATARVGHVTASRIADLMAKTKTGWGASRANYAAQLVAERLTGNASESYSNAAMQWGVETEAQARAAYEFRTDVTCGEAAFLKHPCIEWAGASPDGFVSDDGLVEFKCPNTSTHIDTLLGAKVPEKYVLQMQWQMAVTDRGWCDFVSFDPRLPEEMRMFLRRVERDNVLIRTLENEVQLFLAEIDDTLKQLRRQYAEAA
jgi:putative phage-type endonuclease